MIEQEIFGAVRDCQPHLTSCDLGIPRKALVLVALDAWRYRTRQSSRGSSMPIPTRAPSRTAALAASLEARWLQVARIRIGPLTYTKNHVPYVLGCQFHT